MEDSGLTVQRLFDMSGKVALVTGGCRGLGLDEASTLAEFGAQVVVTSRSLCTAEEAAQDLCSRSKVPVVGLELDVIDEACVKEVFAQIVARFDRLDVLINNAGGAPNADQVSIFDRRLKDWNSVISTNLTGTFLCTQAAALIMRKQRSGSIINISSIAGILGRDQQIYQGLAMRPSFPDYAASKAGVLGLTREIAV